MADSVSVKICHVCAVEFTYRKFLAPLVATLANQGYEMHAAFTPEDWDDLPNPPSLGLSTYHPVLIARSASPWHLASAIFRLFRLFRREHFSIVHVHTPVAAIVVRVAAFLARVPIVFYTAHGFYFHEHMPLLQRLTHIALEYLLAPLTTELLTVSTEDAALARQLRFKPPARIHAIGNGVDTTRFLPPTPSQRLRHRLRFGLSSESLVIGIVARRVLEKGYGDLLEAFAHLARRYPHLQLLLCGDRLASDYAGSVEVLVRDLQNEFPGRVVCSGAIEDPEAAYQAMDIFCLPSWREGLPYTVIEAMLTALPVVATDIRGCREQVLPGVTGLLVPVRQPNSLAIALESMLQEPQSRYQYGTAGRVRALSMYNQDSVLEHQLQIYHMALSHLHSVRPRA